MVVPPPAGMFVKQFAVAFRQMDMTRFAGAFGGESFTKGFNLYAYPAGASFCADKRMQKRFRAAP